MPDNIICCNLEMQFLDTRDDGDVYGCINCNSASLIGDIEEQYDTEKYKKDPIHIEINYIQEEDYGEQNPIFTFMTNNKQSLNYSNGYCTIENETFQITKAITSNESDNTYCISFKTNSLESKKKITEVILFNI